MSDNWIGNIIITNEDSVKDDDAVKFLDLLACDGSYYNTTTYSTLFSKTASITTPTMTSPDTNTAYKIIADLT